MNGKTEGIPSRAVVPHASWSSIFAGVVVAIIAQFTLSLLGLGIGLSTVQPMTEQNPLGGLGTGSLIWWLITSIISLFIGGWVASRLAGVQDGFDGALHGIVTWGLSMIVAVFLLTSTIGAVIGGGMSLVKNVMQFSGQAAQAAPGQAQGVIGQAQQQLQQGQQQAQNLTPEQKQQMEAKARESAEKAASTASKGAIGSFFMLILGGASAAIGGSVGRAKGPVKV